MPHAAATSRATSAAFPAADKYRRLFVCADSVARSDASGAGLLGRVSFPDIASPLLDLTPLYGINAFY